MLYHLSPEDLRWGNKAQILSHNACHLEPLQYSLCLYYTNYMCQIRIKMQECSLEEKKLHLCIHFDVAVRILFLPDTQ